MTVIRTERGWAGHFCAARNCLFRRNTLLECGEQRVVVSTVGNWINGDERGKRAGKPEQIGLDRYYETMAFGANLQGQYWDADVTRQLYFDAPWSVDHIRDDADAEANANHEAVVAELTARMGNGEAVVPEPRAEDEP